MMSPMVVLVEDDDEEEEEDGAAADCVLLCCGRGGGEEVGWGRGQRDWAPKMDSRQVSVRPPWGAVSVAPPEGLEEGQHIFASIRGPDICISPTWILGVEGSFGIDSPFTDNVADSGIAFERGVISRVMGALPYICCKV